MVTTNRAGSRSAAEHLVARGASRPAMITGPAEYGAVRGRDPGFRDGLEAAGLALDEALAVEGDFTESGGSPPRPGCWIAAPPSTDRSTTTT